jgi:fumarylacetoacetase
MPTPPPPASFSSPALNETHDPALRSWVESANDPASEFPIQNLPLCAFQAQHDGHSHTHLGVAIGDSILDVSMLNEAGFFGDDKHLAGMLRYPFWDAVAMAPRDDTGLSSIARIRRVAQLFLRADAQGGQQARRLRDKAIRPMAGTLFAPPARMFNYTDFYASIHHARTVGSMFRPDNPLLPNYKHVPIGYHGRASSIVVSGTPITRPMGQQSPPESDPATPPTFGPCKLLDYELEVGMVIGTPNKLGQPVPISQAREHILGLCLVNDWSARDIQKWEYQPLGPFLAKNFATTISPFIVTLEALEPFRCAPAARPASDPKPLAYLWDDADQQSGSFDLILEAWLTSEQMRAKSPGSAEGKPVLLSRSHAFRELYWTLAQLLTHHTSNGCNLLTGDLLASGTVSGEGANERGCLLELTWQGTGPDGKPLPRKPIQLPTGETRTFLADGDELTLRGTCAREGYRSIGFGVCSGRIEAAKA